MIDKIEENKVYRCIPESYRTESYIGYPRGPRSIYINIRDRYFKNSEGNIDYRTNHSFTQQNTFEATEEETNWFLKCVELNKYISLEDFRELQPKYKELNPYNI